MTDSDFPLPEALAPLFRGGAAGRRLDVPLPDGRLMTADSSPAPVFWMSNQPIDGATWAAFRARHPQSGLWPLLLLHDLDGATDRPWESGELTPESAAEIDAYDAADHMADEWAEWVEEEDDEGTDDFEDLEPFGPECPGLAPPGEPSADPGEAADWYAKQLDGQHGHLGLVAADRGADALTVMGWTGPCNHQETPPLSAMLRSWESRFGARVVAVGFDTLYVSVAAPPTTMEHALHVAAEHFTFCPDNIQQGHSPYTLRAYAERLVGVNSWAFWWD
ncbi:hypothetical protein Pth03_59910 [Planotetraspora thailandica]|uniref:DUF4253 domain-containing protein n=1 Tax=Planotetraspora thailandica TaxID=487172 RepID=A0A8J3V571_9ACTN|nr:DUF4253 domain-containing protein [Planotetraspora thailandica]GII57602.1 hypothetical protein Pth03_59910 [Planotetraspora thailandica]